MYRLIKAVFSCTGFWEGWREGGGGCFASCVLWRFVTLRGAGVQRNACLLQSVRERLRHVKDVQTKKCY